MDRTLIYKPITTIGDVVRLLRMLYEAGDLYHCEDDASEIVRSNGKRVFKHHEAKALNGRMVEAYQLEWPEGCCPCTVALAQDPEWITEIEKRIAEGGYGETHALHCYLQYTRTTNWDGR